VSERLCWVAVVSWSCFESCWNMGVPAFFRWISEKYPKILIEVQEEKPFLRHGVPAPIDATKPLPQGFEFDNLYIDMNGVIHPCSHPEDHPGASPRLALHGVAR
jgi:5'-3' exonuclease